MKEFWKSWKFWVVVVFVVLLIVGMVLYFTVPAFKVVVLEVLAGVCAVAVGYLLGRYVK